MNKVPPVTKIMAKKSWHHAKKRLRLVPYSPAQKSRPSRISVESSAGTSSDRVNIAIDKASATG